MPKTKILVVEDETSIRDLCAVILNSSGYESIVATNGKEGLEVYQARHDEICLVLSDITMPVLDGVEMTRKILEMDSQANVILMSGYILTELIPDEVRTHCSVIEKPFTAGRLLEAVQKCLKYDAEQHPSLAG